MLTHWVWLTTRRGIGTRGRAKLLKMFKTAEAIYALHQEDCKAAAGFEGRWLEPLMDKSLTEAERIVRQCRSLNIKLLTYADAAYPRRLRMISDPPALLYYRGEFPAFDQEAVIAVVGSRRCSAYGLFNARQFGRLIAQSGGVVISGGARGIDTMALTGALDSDMPVACVVGSGLDAPYPRENEELFRSVEAHGCMISEYPPGTPPERSHFPVRNRILSGLSLGVLVVEAPERSGALITAQQALEQGRDVYAVPGNLGSACCEGSNRLLREGAYLVENGWDLLCNYFGDFPGKLRDGRARSAREELLRERYGRELPVYSPTLLPKGSDKKDIDNSPVKAYIDKKAPPPVELTEREAAVYALLESGLVLHVDQLVQDSGLSVSQVMAALTMLQIKQLVCKLPGSRFQRIS